MVVTFDKIGGFFMIILGIDPGYSGGFVFYEILGAKTSVIFEPMPLIILGKEKEIDFLKVREILAFGAADHIFLERAMPFAMGSKHAFNYGRGFAALEIAIKLSKIPVTYVEPKKWCSVMHAGISDDLKPKIKSEIALSRLAPSLLKNIPMTKKGKPHDGAMDSLLIAIYGARALNVSK